MVQMQREAAQAHKAATPVEDEKSAHNVVSVSPIPQPRAASPKLRSTSPIAALPPTGISIALPSQSPRGPPRTSHGADVERDEGTPKSASSMGKLVEQPVAKTRTGLYMAGRQSAYHSDEDNVPFGIAKSAGDKFTQHMNASQRTGPPQTNAFGYGVGDLVIYTDPLKGGTCELYKVTGTSNDRYCIQPADGPDGENVKEVYRYTLTRTRRRVLERISQDIENAKRM